MNGRAIFLLLLPFFLAGCLWESPEELGRLTKEDPAFRQMIVARDQAHLQEHLVKEELLSKKKIMDAQIEKLRAEYDAYAKAQNKKIEQYQATIDANRDLLRRQIDSGSAALETKQKTLEEYEKTLSDVKKVLHETKGITLSPQEKQKWQERALLLSEKIRPLTDEIQELKLQIRLKRQKIHYLQ